MRHREWPLKNDIDQEAVLKTHGDRFINMAYWDNNMDT